MNLRINRSTEIPRWLPVAAVSAIAIGLGSCGSNLSATSESPQTDSSPAATSDELQVVTTFLPMTQFTKAVAGDRATVTQLLPPNVGPHDYQAKPEDVQRLAEADVLVQNGLEVETFLDDLIANADNPDLDIIVSSEGIETIATADVAAHDYETDQVNEEEQAGDGHGDEEHADEEHADEEHADEEQADREQVGGEQADSEHHHHGQDNPHVWLDPKRAIQQVETIRDGLIAADPGGQADYTVNAAAFIAQLQELDAEIASTLQPYAGKTFIAFHDFAPYFAQSYDLEAAFLVDIPEENPSPDDIKRVTDEVQTSDLKAILTEPQAGESSLSALADDLSVTISTFDSIETGPPEALEPDYYLTIMRQNVANLVTAFGGSPQSVLPSWNPQPIAVAPEAK